MTAGWDVRKLRDAVAAPLGGGELRLPATLGKYRLFREVARGAMGVVYEAEDLELKRGVAVKVLRDEVGDVVRQRFQREARAAAHLSHPNVVKVFDAGEQDGHRYLVMEYVEGRSLREIFDIGVIEQRPMLRLLQQVALGVASAHDAGIVHRDLKPANILLTPAGEPKVGDFGLAHWVDAETALTKTGTPLGTPLYMAPEQVRGSGDDITPATDVYALGAILYEILTGRPPHIGENVMEIYSKIVGHEPMAPHELNPKANREIETICLKAIELDPRRRYPTAREFAEDLRRHLDGESILAQPPGAVSVGVKWVRRHRTFSTASAVALAVAVAFAAWKVNDDARRREERREAADRAIDEGRDFRGQAVRLRGEVAALRTREDELRAKIPPDDAGGRKEPLWETQRSLEEATRRLETAVAAASASFSGAMRVGADPAVAKSELAGLHFEGLEWAEAEEDDARASMHRWLVRAYDDGTWMRKVDEPGTISLDTAPPGARVELMKYAEEKDRRLVAKPDRSLGRSPVAPTQIPPGSYLLVLTFEGRSETRLPVVVRRGSTQALKAVLYPAATVGDDYLPVPGGTFILGGDAQAYQAALRDASARADDFLISRFEVTFDDYGAFLDDLRATGRAAEAARRTPRRQEVPLAPQASPRWAVVGVTWDDADAYARWMTDRPGAAATYRLPTSVEWEKAARGVDGRRFPWGNHFDWSFAKGGLSRPPATGAEAVGTFAMDESPYGARDMAGNVQEWCDDTWDESGPERRVVRGGGAGTMEPAIMRSATRMWALAADRITGRGFRLVKIPRKNF